MKPAVRTQLNLEDTCERLPGRKQTLRDGDRSLEKSNSGFNLIWRIKVGLWNNAQRSCGPDLRCCRVTSWIFFSPKILTSNC